MEGMSLRWGTRDWYLMHYSTPSITRGQKHTHTELAISQSHGMENLHWDSWDGEILHIGLVISMHDNITSCIMLWDLVVHLLGVGLLSSSWEM